MQKYFIIKVGKKEMKKKKNIFEQYLESLPSFTTEKEQFDYQKNFMLNLSPQDLIDFLHFQKEAVFADLRNVLDNCSQKDTDDISLYVDALQNAIAVPVSLKAA